MKANEGDLVIVDWVDAAGFVNEPLERVKLADARSVGWLIRETKNMLIVQSCKYEDDIGDYTAIPKGWTLKVEVV